MAEVIQVQLDIETKKAQSNVENLSKDIVDLNKDVVKGNKATEKSLEGIEKTSEKTAGGVKKIGGALKALGIGLIIAGFAKFMEVLNENQKVADFFSITFETLSLAFNDFFNFILSNTDAITNFFKAAFDDPIQNIKDFGNSLYEGVIVRFNEALEVLGYLGAAIEKLFKGDFAGAMDAASMAGKQFVDVITGVDDSFDKTVESVKNVIEATSNYVTQTIKAATENVNLAKTAELAAVANQGLIEKYDLQAEKLRQVRDEERNTIAVRKKANDDLNAVLDEQEKTMLANANAILAAAQSQYSKNQNDENQIALLEAQNELIAVQAQIAGFRSEQKSNDLALDRERLELDQAISEGEAARNQTQSEFSAEQIENDYLRLQAQLDIAEQERISEEKRLTEKRDLYQQGTQAYEDANNELLLYQQENANNQVKIEKDLAKAKTQIMTSALGNIVSIVGKGSKFGKAIAIVQAIRDTYAGATKAFAQGGIFGFIGAAAITAAGLANVNQITSTPDPTPPAGLGASVGGQSMPSIPSSTPPAFNVVGQGETSQLANAIGSQASQPMRAYVVSNDVTTAQGLERNIVEGATI